MRVHTKLLFQVKYFGNFFIVSRKNNIASDIDIITDIITYINLTIYLKSKNTLKRQTFGI